MISANRQKKFLAVDWLFIGFDACEFLCDFCVIFVSFDLRVECLQHDVRLDSIPTTDRMKNSMSKTKWFLDITEATKNILAFIDWCLIDFDACEFLCDFCVIFVSLDLRVECFQHDVGSVTISPTNTMTKIINQQI